nr:HAMP domain-containing histidine kinase [Actinomycetota bacterium]
EAVDQRRDLIGTITHEFRTPLTCIEGFSTALLDGWDSYADDERRDLLGRIRHHSEELDDLVSRFLDFAVTERGGLSAHIGAVELAPAVTKTVEALSPLLAERQVDVDIPDLLVTADPALLRRTLANLVSNAVKYSSPGTRVSVQARAEDGHARLEVTDEGLGLSPADAARAFEPFWRGGGATTRTTRGAGLGLALVAEYARTMGGTSGVTSEPGRGSCFYVTLPLATLPAATEGEQGGSAR